jgi:hypothetical protein
MYKSQQEIQKHKTTLLFQSSKARNSSITKAKGNDSSITKAKGSEMVEMLDKESKSLVLEMINGLKDDSNKQETSLRLGQKN